MNAYLWKRLVFVMVLIGVVGFLSVPMGLAVPGNSEILVLDREPFYSPASVNLQAGQSIQWQNQSSQSHTITHDRCGERYGCAFHSGHLHPGEDFTVRDLATGTYPYHCNIHPFMRGVIVVDQKPTRNYHSTEL
ncbi:MAG: cupredoxin domain-containing protein [Nitrospirae bacterium]|nr:cupredoxin domain-containing protein [Nitrospirota bacterium]MDA1304238.1 cupredoxin domain-containing protein [Nitrospirota bacterium]